MPVIDASSDSQVNATNDNPTIINTARPGEITGSPSISVQKIEAVLAQYGSPPSAKGRAFTTWASSTASTPHMPWRSLSTRAVAAQKDGALHQVARKHRHHSRLCRLRRLSQLPHLEEGMEDWYKLISTLYVGQWGLKTIDAIIPVYAPWGDNNNPPGYIASVKGMVESWRGMSE